MDNSKVCSILGSIYSRMLECESIDGEHLEILQRGSLADINRTELECLVKDLYNEHSCLSSLLIDISHLYDSVRNFPFLFDDNNNK